MKGKLAWSRVKSMAYPGELRSITKLEFPDLPEKMAFMRCLIDYYSDPSNPCGVAVRELAVEIVRGKAPARDYMAQLRALLEHAQQWYYINEPVELFQTPLYTISHGYGDCDDFTLALGALCESICIPTALDVLAWKNPTPAALGQLWHGHETPGELFPDNGDIPAKHVYLSALVPPKKPTQAIPLEPTLPVEVGFDPAQFAARRLATAAGLY